MGWLQRTKALFQSKKLSEDHRDELEFHLAMREQLNVTQGMSQEDARRDARQRFGNPVSLHERMREVDLVTWPGSVYQDLRFGLRTLLKHPGFTASAVLALALGIGVNTAVFTVYKAVIYRSLDARDPGKMVNVALSRESGDTDPMFSYADYLAFRDHITAFSGVIAEAGEKLTLTGVPSPTHEQHSALGTIAGKFGMVSPRLSSSGAEFATVAEISENYFEVLGTPAFRGRLIASRDTRDFQAHPAVMISENYWTMRFEADPAIVGKIVKLNGASFTVIGITPHNFVGTGITAPDFWIPLTLQPLLHPDADSFHDRENECCRIFGRLAPGVTMHKAQVEVDVIANHLRSLHDPKSEASKPVAAQIWQGSPFGRKIDSSLSFAVFLIMLAVGMVLVIACANVASLQLARAAARQNELSMRLSLGASRGRLIRQLLTESALLGVIAGAVALLFTWGFLHTIAVEMSTALPPEWGSFVMHVDPDMKIFAYVLGISLLAGVLFGLAPAFESSRSAVKSSLKANQETSPARGRRLRDSLISAQVAVCLVLMIAGSLLIRGSIHSLNMDTGYETKHVINLELQYPEGTKYDGARKRTILREIRSRVSALPDVTATTVGRAPDGGGVRTAQVSIAGHSSDDRSSGPYLFYTYVLPNYFKTLNISLLAGRGFQAQSGAPEPLVVVSESAAAELWPGQNPLGQKISMSTLNQYHGKDEYVPDGSLYLPLPEGHIDEHPLLIRTQSDPALTSRSIGSAIASVDANVVGYTSTLDEMLHFTPPFVVSRCAAVFTSVVGAFGLLLASMGIYGTVSYVVLLRTREMGIRMALGASKGRLFGLILRESMRPVIVGLGVGIVLSLCASHLLRTLLYGLGTVDVLSFAGVSLFFLAIASFATYIPSRAATRVHPVVALRCE
jgi:predicted permease